MWFIGLTQEIDNMKQEKCPTCGSDVAVGGEGVTHFYVPIIKYEPYVYKAEIISVYDGDTCTAIVDLGMNVNIEIKIRLAGINAPEIRGKERDKGLIVRDYLRELILNKSVIIKTQKDKTGKYGRWIADIWINEVNVNELLIVKGYAVPYGK